MNMSFTRCALFLFTGWIAACTSGKDAGRVEGAVPKIGVVQTKRPPRLDGLLDDSAWGVANTTRAFVETRKGGDAPIQASAKFLWDEGYLYVGVDVHDTLLRASHTGRDDHLWEQDCVELMLDPDGDEKNYFEIQVSPRGGLDDKEADAGYTVEMAIPWQAFSLDGKPLAPPRFGDEWRANLYVMDLLEDRQQAAAWSSLGIGDFHVPRRFGILAFEGPGNRMPKPMKREGAQTLESPEAPH